MILVSALCNIRELKYITTDLLPAIKTQFKNFIDKPNILFLLEFKNCLFPQISMSTELSPLDSLKCPQAQNFVFGLVLLSILNKLDCKINSLVWQLEHKNIL